MKYFFIFSILCIAGVQSLRTRFNNGAFSHRRQSAFAQTKVYIEECAKQLDLPVFKQEIAYPVIELMTYFYPGRKSDKGLCMTTCIAGKKANSIGFQLHELLLNAINMVYAYDKGSPKVTRDELKSRVNYCRSKESNDCEFYKCLDVMKPPFAHLGATLLKPYIVYALRFIY